MHEDLSTLEELALRGAYTVLYDAFAYLCNRPDAHAKAILNLARQELLVDLNRIHGEAAEAVLPSKY